MSTFPAGWRSRAELALQAARGFVTTTRADLRDIWQQVIAPGAERAPTAAVGGSTANNEDATTASEAPAASAAATARRKRRERQREDFGAPVLARRGDDLATVLGRIDAADQPEVLLVVPRGVRSLRTAAAWLRIAGYARRRGLTVHVVAARSEVRAFARQSGLEAARTRHGLPGGRGPLTPWDFAFPLALPHPRDSVGGQALVLLAIPAAAVVGFAYFGPLARIEVSPPSTAVQEQVQLRIDPIASRIDVKTATLPATTVQRSVRAIVSAPTTGEVPVGDRPAAVRLEFRNDGESAIDLPAGTIARGDQPPAFATTAPLSVPPGQRAAIDAIALQPGTVGNLGPGAVRLLDGYPPTLSVTNPVPARGGTDRFVPGVIQADVDRVRGLADRVLAQAAVHQAREAYEGGLVLPGSVSVAILGQTPFQRLNEPAELFVAEYVAQAAVHVVLPETASSFAEAYLRSKAPAGREVVPELSRVEFGELTSEGGQPRAQATINGRTADRLDGPALAAAVAGATPEDARERLRELLKLDIAPRVRVSPTWLPWPWLPRRADRIEVVLGPPDTAASRPAQ